MHFRLVDLAACIFAAYFPHVLSGFGRMNVKLQKNDFHKRGYCCLDENLLHQLLSFLNAKEDHY